MSVFLGVYNLFCNQTDVILNLAFKLLVACSDIHGVTTHLVCISALGISFFFQIYKNYCKRSPNGEIRKKNYLVVWSRDNIKVNFSPKIGSLCLNFNKITLLKCLCISLNDLSINSYLLKSIATWNKWASLTFFCSFMHSLKYQLCLYTKLTLCVTFISWEIVILWIW